MTTAGRPTVESARGSAFQGGRLYVPSQAFSKRDAPGHTVLKQRQPGQGSEADLAARDLAAELRAREASVAQKGSQASPVAAVAAPPPRPALAAPPPPQPQPQAETKPRAIDADEELDDSDGDEAASSSAAADKVKREAGAEERYSDDEDDDEDDTAALLAELERIKQERAEEQKRKEAAEAASAERARDAAAAVGNPLMPHLPGAEEPASDFVVKKKWYDDTVFRNQSRGEPELRRRFVNDTVRNDFHLRFLRKYIL